MAKRYGILVEHEDGRVGIAYNDEQELYAKDGQVYVHWYSDMTFKIPVLNMLNQNTSCVGKAKVKLKGFVD